MAGRGKAKRQHRRAVKKGDKPMTPAEFKAINNKVLAKSKTAKAKARAKEATRLARLKRKKK